VGPSLFNGPITRTTARSRYGKSSLGCFAKPLPHREIPSHGAGPFNSFSEFNKSEGGDIWFALDETRNPDRAWCAFSPADRGTPPLRFALP
jgi:hypothetical protein